MELLLLDPQIRDWVLFPLIFITIMVQLVRGYISALLESPKKVDMEDVKQKYGRSRAYVTAVNTVVSRVGGGVARCVLGKASGRAFDRVRTCVGV